MTAKRAPGKCQWWGEQIPTHYRTDRVTCSERCRGARVRHGNPRRHLSYRYGLTDHERAEMLKEQGGKCLICKTPEDSLTRPLVVDHDHTTGAVRGLLCSACNTGIGHLKDDPAVVAAALHYLKERTR